MLQKIITHIIIIYIFIHKSFKHKLDLTNFFNLIDTSKKQRDVNNKKATDAPLCENLKNHSHTRRFNFNRLMNGETRAIINSPYPRIRTDDTSLYEISQDSEKGEIIESCVQLVDSRWQIIFNIYPSVRTGGRRGRQDERGTIVKLDLINS